MKKYRKKYISKNNISICIPNTQRGDVPASLASKANIEKIIERRPKRMCAINAYWKERAIKAKETKPKIVKNIDIKNNLFPIISKRQNHFYIYPIPILPLEPSPYPSSIIIVSS